VYETAFVPVAVANSYQAVAWDTTRLLSGFTLSADKTNITVSTAGTYELALHLRLLNGGTTLPVGTALSVHVNGALVDSQQLVLPLLGDGILSVNSLLALNAGDVLDVEFTGGTTNVELEPTGFGGNELVLYQIR
jgi:hypothetical protein